MKKGKPWIRLLIYSLMTISILIFVVVKLWFDKPNQLQIALKFAGQNRFELEEVINHYTIVDADEEKLEAAKFLIANSYIHFSQRIQLTTSNNKPIKFNPLNYPSTPAAGVAKDSVFRISKVSQEKLIDAQELKANYLIKHIDFIVGVWRKSPWKKRVDFDRFCKYILPYRGVDEPITNWGSLLNAKYSPILDSISDKSILNVCKVINAALANDIHYDNRWVSGGLGTQSILEIMDTGSGMCDDLSVYGACVMRSLGIPVAIDFDIHGRFNYGHSWCVVFDEEGKSWSFGTGEEQPGEHIHTFKKFHWRKLAKVFRKDFNINGKGLYSNIEELNSIPPFFRVKNVVDVSDEYIETVNVEHESGELSDNQQYLYLCVYNNKIWQPIQWSEIKGTKVLFTKMGTEIMYLAGYYAYNRLNPVSDPFVIQKDGFKKYITSTEDSTNKPFTLKVIRGFEAPKAGKEYQLFSWEKRRWRYAKSFTAQADSLLIFNGLRKGTLYRFQETSRPFLVDDTLIFW